MRRPLTIARQSARPSGPLGWLIGHIMAGETSADNDALSDLLLLQPGERALEIGCGHGRTLARLAERHPDCDIVGIDHSPSMVRMARRKKGADGSAGGIDVRCASSDRLPLPDDSCDAVMAVHVVYFWPDLTPHLGECRRVLRHGGRLLLGYHEPTDDRRLAFPAPTYTHRTSGELVRALTLAGFDSTCTGQASTRAGDVNWILGR